MKRLSGGKGKAKEGTSADNAFLDQRLQEAVIFLGVLPEQQSSLKIFCDLIKLKDAATYYHCVRVALYGMRIAE